MKAGPVHVQWTQKGAIAASYDVIQGRSMMVMLDIDQLVRYDDLLNTEHEKCLEERISV